MAFTAYATRAEATAYFLRKVDSSAWGTVTATQDKALLNATMLIDMLSYQYDKTDEDQDNEFAFNDETTVPDDIKYACIEIAYALMDDVDIEMEYTNLRVIQQSIANARLTYDRDVRPIHLEYGIPSIIAWRYLVPYLNDQRVINFNRVS